MNSQNEYGNHKDRASSKDKGNKRPSEANEETTKIKNHEESELTYQFQGQYARSKHWLNLDPDWIKDNFITREPEHFKRLCLKNIPVQTNKYWFTFSVPIGTAKKVNFNSIQYPLPWNIRDMTKTVVVLVVWILILNHQNNWLMKIK